MSERMDGDWFERRKRERHAAAKRRRRRDAIVLGVLLSFVVGGFLAVKIVGGGEQDPTRPRGSAPTGATGLEAPSPAPTTSAYDPDAVALGLAKAVVNVFATVDNSADGLPRIDAIQRSTEGATGCVVTAGEAGAERTLAVARSKAFAAADAMGGQFAVAKVQYAEPDWEDQFAWVAVAVTC